MELDWIWSHFEAYPRKKSTELAKGLSSALPLPTSIPHSKSSKHARSRKAWCKACLDAAVSVERSLDEDMAQVAASRVLPRPWAPRSTEDILIQRKRQYISYLYHTFLISHQFGPRKVSAVKMAIFVQNPKTFSNILPTAIAEISWSNTMRA
jgi:hypothetical protein